LYLFKDDNLLASIYHSKGILGYYQGLAPNFLGSTLSWGIYFGIYSLLKDRYSESKLSPIQHLSASAQAGFLTSLLTNPIWVIKTRMCSQSNTYTSVMHAFTKIYKYEGLRGLYKGLLPSMVGVSHGAIQFMLYEQMKQAYLQNQSELTTISTLLMAASSKAVATCLTYPYQVVKSRLQVQTTPSNLLQTIASIYRNESFRGFYKGLHVNILRVMPGTCITFVVYEGLTQLFQSL
jgi:solute carrier family 25 folate transporter 32